MRYTKDIFDILSKGGFVSQNSMQRALLYDDIEDNFRNTKNIMRNWIPIGGRKWLLLFLSHGEQGGTD